MAKKKESKVHKFIKEHFMIIVMFAIMLIPSIYTVLFLGSMWDPYGNTGNLPVAIVNEDQAVMYNGKEVNVGKQLCDNLAKNDALQFNFVDEKVALRGLENGTFYMVMVIPENFSSNSTTLTTDSPEKMQIEYYTNPGTNYIASKFGESAVKTIKENLNKQVINTYATTVYSKLDTIGEGFNEAADGSNQIYNGVGTLKTGNKKMTDGLTTLSNGCLTLKEGTGTLEDGLAQYTDGVEQVNDGAKQLQAGTQQLTANNEKLVDGSQQILDGLQLMSDSLDSSLTEENMKDLERLEDGIMQIDGVIKKVGEVKETADKVIDDDTIKNLQNTVNEIEKFVNSDTFDTIYNFAQDNDVDWKEIIKVIDNIEKLPIINQNTKNTLDNLKAYAERMLKLQELTNNITKEDIQNLISSANKVIKNYDEVDKQLNTLVTDGDYALQMSVNTLERFKGGLQDIQYGLQKTQSKNGETGLIEGMTTLQKGIKDYTNGVSQVDDGVNTLLKGTNKLVSNNNKLNDGANKLNDGAGQLYDGSLQLKDGSLQIDDGCVKLMAGANRLEEALSDGAKQIEETNTGEDAADMFSQPVVDKEIFQRTINTNGEAMSAYMMCAGLWVACLAFCLMFSPFKTSLKNRKTFVAHGFIAFFVAVASAAIMVTLIMAIDGARPAHVLETYLMAMLASVAFMSIVYMLNTLLDSIGSFLLLIFLCMNLSGSAGTYPINLAPKFYQIIHPFMPFTYGVDAFRSTLSTGNSLAKDITVFVGITVMCILLTVLTYQVRRVKLKRAGRKEARLEQQEEVEYYNTQQV